jgi:hypothetical protein
MEVTFRTNPGSRGAATTAKAGLLFCSDMLEGVVFVEIVLGKLKCLPSQWAYPAQRVERA